MLLVADACHKVLRKYNWRIDNSQQSVTNSLAQILSTDYPYTFDELRSRDIRWLVSRTQGASNLYYGSGNINGDLDWVLNFLAWVWSIPDNGFLELTKETRKKILFEIRESVLSNFQLDSGTIPKALDVNPIYGQTMNFVSNHLKIGYFFADFFYSNELNESKSFLHRSYKIKLASKIEESEAGGRPILITKEFPQSSEKFIAINLKLYNAYFQAFSPFLFFHELSSHLWSRLIETSFESELFPEFVVKDNFEEAFVHWTAINYIKFKFFPEDTVPEASVLETLNVLLGELNSGPSYEDLRKAFEIYEIYFYHTYTTSNKRYLRACRTAKGLWTAIYQLLVNRQDNLGVMESWKIMRDFVVELNLANIPKIEKEEFINTLYYFVIPYGDTFIWQQAGASEPSLIRINEEVYEILRRRLRSLLQASETGNSLSGLLFVQNLRDMDKSGEINDLLSSLSTEKIPT